ncbi:UNKNOWN [Stylonychia lemnae]|uniref:TPX2 central domain-containing protein n=1 Tax=Stylonychia lemnae TaxID=5949 RepID=A0A078B340_STYLE|nr:UNKNOWN [Stylonychia lemnae]|eukprot:CDW88686.1 UNKNOWN [Stylonychia lemnae]
MNFSQNTVANLKNPVQVDFSFSCPNPTNNLDISFAPNAKENPLDRSALDQTMMMGCFMDETVAQIEPVPESDEADEQLDQLLKEQNEGTTNIFGVRQKPEKQKVSTEEMIMSEIARKREQKLKEKLKNQKFYLKAIREKPNQQQEAEDIKVKRSKTLAVFTQPQGFNLQTDQRKKNYQIDKKALLSPTATLLRKQSLLTKDSKRLNSGKKTLVIPFNLSESTKISSSTYTSSTQQNPKEFISLKTRIDKFFKEETQCAQRSSHKKLKRSHLERDATNENLSPKSQRSNIDFNRHSGSGKSAQLTKPQSPSLKTNQRHSTKPAVLTSEDMILRELENRGNFKARPLNKMIFEKTLGVPPKMEKMTTNEFMEFNLQTLKRQKTTKHDTQELQTKPFKALELNKKIFEAPIGMYERKSAPPNSYKYEFKDFKFKTEERLQEHKKKDTERLGSVDEKLYRFKAREMPRFPSPPSPQKSQISNNTNFQEFNLCTEKRSKEQKERLSCPPQIKQKFSAIPMPDFIKLHQHNKNIKRDIQLTQPVGFELKSDQRSQLHQRDFGDKLRKEQDELEKKRNFRAQPIPDYDKMKIEILPSDKPLTQPARPLFYADMLPPKKEKSIDSFNNKSTNSPPDFKF